MDIKGEKVQHKKFGKGVVVEVRSNIFIVQFEKASKAFEYPSAFEKFLTFENSDKQKAVEIEIAEKKTLIPQTKNPPKKDPTRPIPPCVETNAEAERRAFWDMFQKALEAKGYPFSLTTRDHYATINRKSANCNLCLGLDFLVQKEFFRIGIYIQDDVQTPHYQRLLSQKNEIERRLGFVPMWTCRGQKNPNTRRIEIQLPFEAYNRDDYKRLIEKGIPIIVKFLEVFSIYLPDAFEKNYQKGANVIRICTPLVRDGAKGYGGKAQVIYDECCRRFGWDNSKRYLFGMMQILYAKEATPEKYSPWFLPHNNLTETKGGNWFNKIQGDTIVEMWLERDDRFYTDKTCRVTFVKNKSGQYVFLGIYEPIEMVIKTLDFEIIKDGEIIKKAGEKVGLKTYRLISKVYPQ